MKSYFRFLSRNKLYTTIEVLGMAVAIAFVVFIGSFVIREYNTDYDIKKQGNIYIGHSDRLFMNSATIKDQLEGKFPQVEDICRMMNTHILGGLQMTVEVGDYNDRQKASVVDENFFRFFPFPLESGAPETVLKEKNSIVISRTFANKVFGKEDPVGKTIKLTINGNSAQMNVTGVFSDFKNTAFYAPEIIYRIDFVKDIYNTLVQNGNGTCVIFFKIADGTDIKSLEDEMETIVRKEDYIYVYGVYKDFNLIPFSDIYSSSVEANAPFEGVIEKDFINLFTAAGVFLLLFAVLNYISLTVAQTGFRAKEMASRRLLGTQRSGIVWRYISESFILTLISFAFSLIIVSYVSPHLSELIGKEISPLKEMGIGELVFMIVVLVVLSLLSGIIPAMLVSKYKPIDVVRGNFARTSKMTLGKVLIGFQSGVAFITLTIATVMFLQLHHMTEKPMGYVKDNRISIMNANNPSDYHLDELKSLACVERVGWLQFEPMGLGTSGTAFKINGEERKFDMFYGDRTAFEILGFKVLRKNGEPLNQNAWLPESTMRALGLDYDCTQVSLDGGGMFPVCGIIEDYHKGGANFGGVSDFMNIAWIKEMEKEDDFRILRTLVVQVSGDENKAADEIKAFYKSKGFNEEEIVVRTYNEINSSLYESENNNLKMLTIFTMLTLLLTVLAMFAMSTYYARQHSKEAALKKVMGSGRIQLLVETSSGFLKSVAVAIIIGLPVAWIAVGEWLKGYSYRIDNPIYVYIITVAIIFFVAIISISWQMIKLMNTNPVKSLKNE